MSYYTQTNKVFTVSEIILYNWVAIFAWKAFFELQLLLIVSCYTSNLQDCRLFFVLYIYIYIYIYTKEIKHLFNIIFYFKLFFNWQQEIKGYKNSNIYVHVLTVFLLLDNIIITFGQDSCKRTVRQ